MKPGDIVLSKDGKKHLIKRDYSTGWFETDRGGIDRLDIDCVIGQKCDKCDREFLYSDGYYQIGGLKLCASCGEIEFNAGLH